VPDLPNYQKFRYFIESQSYNIGYSDLVEFGKKWEEFALVFITLRRYGDAFSVCVLSMSEARQKPSEVHDN